MNLRWTSRSSRCRISFTRRSRTSGPKRRTPVSAGMASPRPRRSNSFQLKNQIGERVRPQKDHQTVRHVVATTITRPVPPFQDGPRESSVTTAKQRPERHGRQPEQHPPHRAGMDTVSSSSDLSSHHAFPADSGGNI